MKKHYIVILLLSLLVLTGCVSGPPYLTKAQENKVNDIKIYRAGSQHIENYTLFEEIKAADCTGPGGSRLYGQEELAIDYLKRKAVALNADAVIDVECGSGAFVNNCWAARICAGKAVIWK